MGNLRPIHASGVPGDGTELSVGFRQITADRRRMGRDEFQLLTFVVRRAEDTGPGLGEATGVREDGLGETDRIVGLAGAV